MAREIQSVKELKKAIREASAVYIQVRFGVSERWVKLAKQEAMVLANDLLANDSPERAEMYSGSFASLEAGELFMG